MASDDVPVGERESVQHGAEVEDTLADADFEGLVITRLPKKDQKTNNLNRQKTDY